MASIKQMETKDGRRFFQICVSRGYGKAPYKTRWYWPDGWSKRTAEREAAKQAAAFELACKNGEVLNRAQEREKAAREAAEAAKLKTVRQYADGVFMPTKEATFSENARSSYRMFLDKHILPVLGDVLLVEVSPAMISKLLIDFQRAGYAHATTVKLYNILNGIFEMAFLDDSIPMNPMLKVKRPAPRKDEQPKEESDKAYTVQELSYILSCAAQEPLQWQTYISLAADTGLRRGECCGLQWSDIDFKAGAVTVRRNLQYTAAAGVYATSPKNGKVRVVDVGPDTLALLKQLREKQAQSCISKWCFTQEGTAEPMHPQSPTRYFQKFGQRYGVKDFHPHKLRHSSASIAITSGADVVSVSERLGHSDTAVTLRMYAHANEESIRRAGQTVRDALKAQQG
ncbi:tyrosine-type recombinase/integrase [Flavonifractor sp. An112]|uniref:tyrosine-type recombinase/integrase n=1 Tax=Flavonifractor sp. An112 TaxID=1965544 RepID=UPI0013025635|nr:site-specific integrase [Flavonifractor sp. An112]